MVSSIYTPNKRIDYLRSLSNALMPKQIRSFNPNVRNPYAQTASTNLANALSGLVQTYSAQQQLGKADQLEAEQLAAQQAIGSQFAQMRTPGTDTTLDVRDMTVPPSQGFRQQQVSRRPISVNTPQFTPAQMTAAGTTPELLQGRVAGIRAGREKAYTARQKAELEAGLTEALRGSDPASRALARQYQTLLDPTAVALREVEERNVRKRKELAQRGGASYNMGWAVDRETKKLVPVSDLQLKENPERYAPVPESTDPGPIPAWVGKTFNALDEQAALAQRGLSINANMNRLVTTGGLTTGAMQPIFTKIKGVLADFGFDVGKDLNAAQVLDAMSSGKALDVRNPKSGQGLPGATSNKDLNFLMKIVPGLAKTNFANEALLIIDTALTRRKLASVRLKMDYVSKNPHKGLIGYSSGDADTALQKIDLFTKDEKARLDALLKSPQVNTLDTGVIGKRIPYIPKEAGD
tara:strand:- start:3469 stop:4863 length:1395 start_codon:yes stop_codon:yes gene_type:complete